MFGLRSNRVRAKAVPEARASAVACFHCGLPTPPVVHDWLMFDGAKRPMCCAACLAAAQLIIGAGFVDQYRAWVGRAAENAQGLDGRG